MVAVAAAAVVVEAAVAVGAAEEAAAVDSAAEVAAVVSAEAEAAAAFEVVAAVVVAADSEVGVADSDAHKIYLLYLHVFFSEIYDCIMNSNGVEETVPAVNPTSIVAFKGSIEESIDLAEPYRTVTERYYSR